MLKIFKKIYWFSLIILLSPHIIFAAEDGPLERLQNTGQSAGIPTATTQAPAGPAQYIGGIIQILSGAFGLIFMIRIIAAGISWMTAGGNVEKAEKARTNIYNASIGLAIALGAFAISYFVTNLLAERTT